MHPTLKKLSLFSFIFIVHINVASALLITCPGRPASTLNWSSSNVAASGCSLQSSYSDPINCSYSPVADTSGSRSISSGTSCNVTLTCGSVSASDTLQYHPELVWNGTTCVAPPTATISDTPDPTYPGQGFTVTWGSTGATSCTVVVTGATSATYAGIPTSGSQVFNYSNIGTYTFTNTCTDSSTGVSSSPVSVTHTVTASDLTASIISPTSYTIGASATIQATITNGGATTTNAGFYTLFQYATDSSGGGAADIGNSNRVTPLVNGNSFTASNTFTVSGPPGTYYARACADKSSSADTGTINESNENNNCSSTWTAITVACAGGTSWNGSACTAPAAPWASITVPACTIALNASTCTSSVSWTSGNLTLALSVRQNGVQFSAASTNAGTSRTLQFGNGAANTFTAVHNGSTLTTTIGVASCVSGTSWDGTMCAAPPSPTATLTVPNCTIVSASSTCSSSVSWTSANLTTTLSVRQNGAQFSTAVTSAGVSRTLQYGSGATNIFTAVHNGSTLDTKTGTASCVSGTSWNGTTCAVIAATTVTVNATSPVATTPSTATTLSFTSSASDSDTTACRPVDSSQNNISGYGYVTGTTTVTLSSATVGSTNGEFTYYIKCRDTVHTSITNTDIVLVDVCPVGFAWNSGSNSCVQIADLTAGSVIPTTAQVGVSTTLSASISNIGGSSTGGNFRNFIQVATGINGAGTVTDLTNVLMSTLAANASATTSRSYTFPSVGTYSARACADKSNSGSSGSITESNEGNNCGAWVTITVGTVTGSLTLPATCTIATSGSSCAVTASWTTSNATNTVTVERAYNPFGTIPGGTGNSGSTNISFAPPGSYTLNLRHNSVTLDSKTITVSCAAGTAWDGSQCQGNPPTVDTVTVGGNHTSSGSLDFTCSNATSYTIVRTTDAPATTVSSGVYPPSPEIRPLAITVTGSYQVNCINALASDSDVVSYDSTPVESTLSLLAAPRTAKAGAVSTLTWSITNPVPSCAITASTVYAAGAPADPVKDAVATMITSQLTGSSTDANDPYGQRLMSTALRTPISGTKALGKKSIILQYTTDFTLNCNGGTPQKVRVQVTNENEG